MRRCAQKEERLRGWAAEHNILLPLGEKKGVHQQSIELHGCLLVLSRPSTPLYSPQEAPKYTQMRLDVPSRTPQVP